jgi:hypothetical protein
MALFLGFPSAHQGVGMSGRAKSPILAVMATGVGKTLLFQLQYSNSQEYEFRHGDCHHPISFIARAYSGEMSAIEHFMRQVGSLTVPFPHPDCHHHHRVSGQQDIWDVIRLVSSIASIGPVCVGRVLHPYVGSNLAA